MNIILVLYFIIMISSYPKVKPSDWIPLKTLIYLQVIDIIFDDYPRFKFNILRLDSYLNSMGLLQRLGWVSTSINV